MSEGRTPRKLFNKPFALPRGLPRVRVEWQAHPLAHALGFELIWRAQEKGGHDAPAIASGCAAIRCILVDEDALPLIASFAAWYCAGRQLAQTRGVPFKLEREKS